MPNPSFMATPRAPMRGATKAPIAGQGTSPATTPAANISALAQARTTAPQTPVENRFAPSAPPARAQGGGQYRAPVATSPAPDPYKAALDTVSQARAGANAQGLTGNTGAAAGSRMVNMPNQGRSAAVLPASGTSFSTLSLAPDLLNVPPLELGISLGRAEVIEELVERRIVITAFRSIFRLRVGEGLVVRRQLGTGEVCVRRHTTTSATATTLALSSPTHSPEDRAKNAPSLRGGEGITSGQSHESGEYRIHFRSATVLVTQLDGRVITQVPVVGVDVEDDSPVRAELAASRMEIGGRSLWA